jgi:serine/threonine protein kinase
MIYLEYVCPVSCCYIFFFSVKLVFKEIVDPLTVKASTPRGDGNYESGSRRRRIEHAIFPLLRGVEAFTSNGSIISLFYNAKYIHGDLHGANVLWSAKKGRSMLIDFYSLQHVAEINTNDIRPDLLPPEFGGTRQLYVNRILHLQPSQVIRQMPLQPLTIDMYALGLSILELLTNRTPPELWQLDWHALWLPLLIGMLHYDVSNVLQVLLTPSQQEGQI